MRPADFREKRVLFAKEGMIQSRADWIVFLNTPESRFSELRDVGVFRKIPNQEQKGDLYRLQLVGAAFFQENVLIATPKIAAFESDRQLHSDWMLLVKAIEWCRSRGGVYSRLEGAGSDDQIDEARTIELYKRLLKWTDRYGIHNEEELVQHSRSGVINWPKTIRTRHPVWTNSAPIYDTPVYLTRKKVNGVLASLQAHTIVKFARLFSTLLDVVIPKAFLAAIDEASDFIRASNCKLPSTKRALEQVEEYLLSTNHDHNRELAKILKEIYGEASRPDSLSLVVYGTTNFHLIWQALCDEMLSPWRCPNPFSALSTQLKQHNGQVSDTWLLPDHFLHHDDAYLILDSKWHDSQHNFSGQDVTKQFFYELTVRPRYQVVGNAFLVPLDNDRVTLCGELLNMIDGVRDQRFLPIKTIGIPWRRAITECIGVSPKMLGREIVETALR